MKISFFAAVSAKTKVLLLCGWRTDLDCLKTAADVFA